MQACDNKWLDVFVTKSDYGFDDIEVCEVQSVELAPSTVGSYDAAIVVDAATEWVLPTWTLDYDNYDATRNAAYKSIKVGDLIRIGEPKHKATTDYLTVLEVREVERVYNGTTVVLPIGKNAIPLAINTGTSETETGTYDVPTKSGIAHIALRLNMTVNCTAIPKDVRKKTEMFKAHAGNHQIVDITNRHESSHAHYPLFRLNPYLSGSTLTANLDSGVKYVNCIKLLGYSVAAKRQVGVAHGHEMSADDYLILRIKEVQGKVVSNNSHANGAFAILYAGATDNNNIGGIEFHRFDAENGIAVQSMQPTILRNLTLEVLDRFGNPAHFGRLHLWFKLLATHG